MSSVSCDEANQKFLYYIDFLCFKFDHESLLSILCAIGCLLMSAWCYKLYFKSNRVILRIMTPKKDLNYNETYCTLTIEII